MKNATKNLIRSVLAVMLVAAMTVCCCSCTPKEKREKDFATAEEFLLYAETKSIDSAVEDILKATEKTDVFEEDFKADTSLDIEIGEPLRLIIAGLLTEKDSDIEFNLKKLGFSSKMTKTSAALKDDLAFILDGEKLLDLSAIADLNKKDLFISVPEIMAKTLKITLGDLFEDEDAIIVITTSGNNAEKPTKEETVNLVREFLLAVLGTVKNVTREEAVISANGVEEACVKLSYTIDEALVKDVCAVINDFVANNANFKAFMRKIWEATKDEDETDFEEFFKSIVDDVKEAVSADDVEEVPDITVENFVADNGHILGVKFSDKELGEGISLGKLEKDGVTYFECKIIAEDMTIVIDGTKKDEKNVRSFEYVVKVGEEEMLTITGSDIDAKKLDDEQLFNGKIALKVSKNLLKKVNLDKMFDAPVIDLEISEKSNKENSFKMTLKNNESMYISISFNNAITENKDEITLPADADCTEDILEFIGSADEEKLETVMEKFPLLAGLILGILFA